ncbi:MAG: hypothetical protein V4792_04715 [Pseudomonadota bacterium]
MLQRTTASQHLSQANVLPAAPHPDGKCLSTPQEKHRGALSQALLLGLDDLLGDLRHARRSADMGRLALLAYCEVRRWARMAGDKELAARSSALITRAPHASREEFLVQVDYLIAALEVSAKH